VQNRCPKEKECVCYKEQDGERARNAGELVDPANALDCSSVERKDGKERWLININRLSTNKFDCGCKWQMFQVQALSLHMYVSFNPLIWILSIHPRGFTDASTVLDFQSQCSTFVCVTRAMRHVKTRTDLR
jgi:hypothetical protein